MGTEPRLSTLQQERSRLTRQKLMHTAEQLWRANGFDATTVSEVCDAAGVAKGTFYFYFPRKERLLVELAVITAERVSDEVILALEADLPIEAALWRAMEVVADEVQHTDRELLARMLVELYRQVGNTNETQGERPAFSSTFELVFRRAQERGEIPDEFTPGELAEALTTAALAGMLGWATGRAGTASLETVLWRIAQVVLNGARVRQNWVF